MRTRGRGKGEIVTLGRLICFERRDEDGTRAADLRAVADNATFPISSDCALVRQFCVYVSSLFFFV